MQRLLPGDVPAFPTRLQVMGALPRDDWQDSATLGPDPPSCKVKSACSWGTGSGRVGEGVMAGRF